MKANSLLEVKTTQVYDIAGHGECLMSASAGCEQIVSRSKHIPDWLVEVADYAYDGEAFLVRRFRILPFSRYSRSHPTARVRAAFTACSEVTLSCSIVRLVDERDIFIS
jgi:hypothetical protein